MDESKPIPGSDTLPQGFPQPPKDAETSTPDDVTPQTVPIADLLRLIDRQPDGPGKIEAAQAAPATASFWQVLYRSNYWREDESSATFFGASTPLLADFFVPLENASGDHCPPGSTTIVERPCALACLDVPATGWYVVNLVASGDDSAITAWTYVPGEGWIKEYDFAETGGSGSKSHPILVHLASGKHWFCYTVNTSTAWISWITAQSIGTD